MSLLFYALVIPFVCIWCRSENKLLLPTATTTCTTILIPSAFTSFFPQSALMPCRFTFLTTEGSSYVSMFKHGDDLRQDQLVLQIIMLMDKVHLSVYGSDLWSFLSMDVPFIL